MNVEGNRPNFSKIRPSTIAFFILLLIFVGYAGFFALKLRRAIIPDEPQHLLISQLFSSTWSIPPDTAETIGYGVLANHPFLFYWINARIINFLNWIDPTLSAWALLVILRLLSILYSTLTMIYCYLFAKEIIDNRWGQILVIFLLTNTLMFVFLSGGVNYDNLVNLCSFAGVYYLTLVLKGKFFYLNTLMWLVALLLGTLTKVTVLPLACITGLLWLVYVLKHSRQLPIYQFSKDLKMGFLAVFVAALLLLNLYLYGGAIVKFRTLLPSCDQVLTDQQCQNYPQYARDKALGLTEKLTIFTVIKGGYPDPVEYVFDFWVTALLTRVYGIMGHKSYDPDVLITFHRLFILWIIFITVKYWKRPSSYALMAAYIIFLGYAIILLADNYNTELFYGFKHVGIQGRYIFPVIGVYYTILVLLIMNIRSSTLRWVTLGCVMLLFLSGSPMLVLLQLQKSIFATWFV